MHMSGTYMWPIHVDAMLVSRLHNRSLKFRLGLSYYTCVVFKLLV